MNIGIFISTLKYGGAEKQTILDANILSNKYNVILICFNPEPLKDLLNKKVNLVQIKKKNYLLNSFRLSRIIRENNIDVIHASLFAAMIISAVTSLFTPKINIFWHFHSHEYELPFINRQLYRWLGRLSSVKQILFVSIELQSFLIPQLKLPKGKTSVLYNTGSFIPSQRSNNNKGKCIIGYIGRLVELKRIDLLIELAELLILKENNVFSLIIVGDGEERERLEDLTAKKNLNNFIKFEGFCTNTEIYYDKIDIFVMPSQEECLSLALIDAGIKGIPIVAFDVGGNNEIINSGKTGFIVNTKEEFFDRIHLLVTNKIIREQMGVAASVYCYEKFKKEKHLLQLETLYKNAGI